MMLNRLIAAAVFTLALGSAASSGQTSPGAGPIVVIETDKGTIEFETYPEEAPKTVAHVLALVKRNFYNGQRFHRAEPNFVIQAGDPQTRNMTLHEWWGRGDASGSGKPVGVSEITRKRTHVRGAVGMAYAGTDPRLADSQFYIVLRPAPELNAKYTVFGRVIKGMDVAARIKRADMLKKVYVKAAPATP